MVGIEARPSTQPPMVGGDERPRWRLVGSPGSWVVWSGVAVFFIFLAGVIGSVLVSSFGQQWFGTWLPQGWTLSWYGESWRNYGLSQVIGVTLIVSLAVVALAAVIGVPASYILARRSFPFKKLVMVLFLLPILIPPITYGIPLATVMYKFGLGGTLPGVILVNLVPSVPFVILTMTPFIEQINPSIEHAARMCGASMRSVFVRILAPLLVPGILAASILVLVRTVGMFELTFLVAGRDSTTLVVALFNAMSAAGIRAQQTVDAMAVMYTGTMMILLIIALRYVNPTQLVAQVQETRED